LHGRHVALAALLACAGCAPLEDGVTSGGTWRVVADEDGWVVGWNDIAVEVLDTSGEVAAVTLTADVTMPSMGHGSSDDVIVVADGDAWTVTAFFQMVGAWEVGGAVAAGGAEETWALPIEVLAQ